MVMGSIFVHIFSRSNACLVGQGHEGLRTAPVAAVDQGKRIVILPDISNYASEGNFGKPLPATVRVHQVVAWGVVRVDNGLL